MTEVLNGILVFLDRELSDAQPALKKALILARSAKVPLTVAVNAYSPTLRRAVELEEHYYLEAEDKLRHAWRRRIDELIDDGRGPLEVEKRIILDKDVEDNLRRTVMECRPELIVVHTNPEGTLRRHLFTPRDWMLIRHAPCAVLCVQDRPWSTPPKITLAVEPEARADGLDDAILRGARRWAEPLQAELDAVHVMEYPDEATILAAGETLPEYAVNATDLRDYYKRLLKHFTETHGLPEDRTHLLEGSVSRVLTEYCKEHGSDWLVVGTVRRGVFERLLLGATAEALLTRAENDVLVIKPEDFISDWRPAS